MKRTTLLCLPHWVKVVANLLTLGLLLRTYLSKAEGTDFVDANPNVAPESEWVNETALTDFRPLSKVIEQFNTMAAKDGRPMISTDIVALRNAIAHGRLGAFGDSDHFNLIKYGSPKAGKVRVESNWECSALWFEEANRLVRDAIAKVSEEILRRFPSSLIF